MRKEKGMTLIESLFFLISFLLLTHFLFYFIQWKGWQIPNERVSEEMERYLFHIEVDEWLQQAQHIFTTGPYGALHIETKDGTYTIEKSKEVIRARKNGQGHLPLVTNVANVQFLYEDPFVHYTIHWLSGKKEEGRWVYVEK